MKIEEKIESWKTYVVLVPNWEKAPIRGHGKENLRRQDDVRMRGIRCDRKRVRQEIQVGQTSELQQPKNNRVVAKHQSICAFGRKALSKLYQRGSASASLDGLSLSGNQGNGPPFADALGHRPYEFDGAERQMGSEFYLQAQREWEERYSDLVLGKTQLADRVSGLMLPSIVLALGIVWMSARSKVIPYIVEVDNLEATRSRSRSAHLLDHARDRRAHGALRDRGLHP